MANDAPRGDYTPADSVGRYFSHPDDVGLGGESFPRTPQRKWPTIVITAIVSSLLTFAVTWALTSSRSVSVTLVAPKPSSSAATPAASVDPKSSGQVALSATELVNVVKSVGQPVYWAGATQGASYTLDRTTGGQYFIRYLPGGKGLTDAQQNYRVIATYQDSNAYATLQTAGKSADAVSFTNPDGSLVYYSKATPTHVYLAYKDLGIQIEIFDPTPGASLKLATTPGVISQVR